MSDCYFCGQPDNQITEEHVWPKWVSRLLLTQYNATHFQHFRAAGDNTTGLWKSRYLNVTTATVCDSCNNKWLSTFENDCIKPLASPLIIGKSPARLPRESQALLAAWAYKMAMLLEIAHPDTKSPFFTPEERKLFRQTTQAHSLVRVFLSRYEYGQRPAHALTPLHTFTQRGGERKTFELKISTITAGHLAMQVMSVRSPATGQLVPASELEFELLGKAKHAIMRIWPTAPESLTWPPAATMTHHDIEEWTQMWGKPAMPSDQGAGDDPASLENT
jgi:hypothetical protein